MTGTRGGVFFKTAGLVVIMFALFNLTSSLAAIGLISCSVAVTTRNILRVGG